jgi:hypothetical protein
MKCAPSFRLDILIVYGYDRAAFITVSASDLGRGFSFARVPFSSGARTCRTRGMLTWAGEAKILSLIPALNAKNLGR